MPGTETKKEKATSMIIEKVEFRLPFKMKKEIFKKNYGKRFGDRTDKHFETLNNAK